MTSRGGPSSIDVVELSGRDDRIANGDDDDDGNRLRTRKNVVADQRVFWASAIVGFAVGIILLPVAICSRNTAFRYGVFLGTGAACGCAGAVTIGLGAAWHREVMWMTGIGAVGAGGLFVRYAVKGWTGVLRARPAASNDVELVVGVFCSLLVVIGILATLVSLATDGLMRGM